MSSQRYRRLLTNLPSMASVVNSFHSPEVQLSVYRTLIEAMEEALTDGEAGDVRSTSGSVSGSMLLSAPVATGGASSSRKASRAARKDEAGPLAELVEGDSIHSIAVES